jgi:hypothetical protein
MNFILELLFEIMSVSSSEAPKRFNEFSLDRNLEASAASGHRTEATPDSFHASHKRVSTVAIIGMQMN